MGLRKTLSNLFKDPEQVAKEERRKKEREKRRKSLEIQNRIDAVEGEIADMKNESRNLWNQAKAMVRQGQKQSAAELVRAHDDMEANILKKSRKALGFKMMLEKMNDSASDAAIITGLKGYADTLEMDISVADLQMDLGDIQLATAGIDDLDRAIDKVISRDMNKAPKQPTEIRASEESMKLLEEELASEMNAEMTEGPSAEVTGQATGAGVAAEADAGLEELKALMGNTPKS